MNIDQIEIILLMVRSDEAKLHGAPVRVEGDPNSFAVDAHEDCLLIGAISQQSQTKSDMHGEDNLKIQRGTHSAPRSFNDVIELFGPDTSKLRILDANVARFELRATEIEALIRKGLLKSEERNERKTILQTLYTFLEDNFGTPRGSPRYSACPPANFAAVASETGEVSLPYADAFARLQSARPYGVDGARWLMAIRDAGIFLDRWRQIAFSLGWPAADLFEWTANGAAGLVWEIRGGEVTKLTDDLALIENTSWACFACFARPTKREQG